MSMKKGLEDAKITLWVSICVPSSQAKVTSAKSWSFLSPPKAEFRFSWKSFHLRQSFSWLCILSFTRTDWEIQQYQAIITMIANAVPGQNSLWGNNVDILPLWFIYVCLWTLKWERHAKCSTSQSCFSFKVDANKIPSIQSHNRKTKQVGWWLVCEQGNHSSSEPPKQDNKIGKIKPMLRSDQNFWQCSL